MPRLMDLRAAWRAQHRPGDNSPLTFRDGLKRMPDAREGIAKRFAQERTAARQRAYLMGEIPTMSGRDY